MRQWRLVLLAAGLVVALAGCESAPIKGVREAFSSLTSRGHAGAQDLASGIKYYEEGRYGDASRLISSSIEQGLSRPDEVRAHKYLAFIHCVSGREARCRDEFRSSLELDPSFDLAANEAGHPIWGPVFRSVKAGR